MNYKLSLIFFLLAFCGSPISTFAAEFGSYNINRYGTATTNFWEHNYYQTKSWDTPANTWVTHTGKDFQIGGNSQHVSIYSYGFGKVIGVNSTYNAVTVRHLIENGEYVWVNLLHLNKVTEKLTNNYIVPNQILGTEGNTGLGFSDPDTNTHLHLEVAKQVSLAWVPTAEACFGNGCTNAEHSANFDLGDLSGHYRIAGSNQKNAAFNGRVWYDPSVFQKHVELIPYLSNSSNSPSFSAYDVYGYAGSKIYGKLNLTGSFQRSSIIARNATSRNMVDSASSLDEAHTFFGGLNENAYVSGIQASNQYTAGDYLFAAYVKKSSTEHRFGYPVKFSFVNTGDIIVDNDQKNADDNTNNDSTTTPVYNGTQTSATLGNKVPGYFLTADLFFGKSNSYAQWKPNSANNYRIYVHIPESGANASSVRYKIKPDGVTTIVSQPVNQKAHANEWVQLVATDNSSTFAFNKLGFVGLSLGSDTSDQNYALATNEAVAFDAVKFEAVQNTTTSTSGTSEADTLVGTAHETSWAYFQDEKLSNWFISNVTGVTYGLGLNSKNHAAWVAIGDSANVAKVDFSSKKVTLNSNTYTSPQTYQVTSLVGGEGTEWMYSNLASNWAHLIEGKTHPAKWYFFRVASSGKWYIIQIEGNNSTILSLNLTIDNSNYNWKPPLDKNGNGVDTTNWKKNFYQAANGKWMLEITK